MKRRIVQHGPATLTVSLPSAWVRSFALKKGDEITIEPFHNALLLTAHHEQRHGQKRVSVRGVPRLISRLLGALYKAGYDEIIVEYETPIERDRIHDTVASSYIGFEIVDENPSAVTIRTIGDLSAEEFRPLFRRICYVLRTIADDGYNAAITGNKDTYKQLIQSDKTINRLAKFCARVLNKHGQREFEHSAPAHHMVEQLEKIGDTYKELHTHLRDHTIATARTLTLYARVNTFLRDYDTLFFHFSVDHLDRHLQTYDELTADLKVAASDDPLTISLLHAIVREIKDLATTTAILRL